MERTAEIERNTKETRIALSLNLDGDGSSQINVPIGFMEHMLETMARHGLFNITLKARGDLHVDSHHLVEDLGIVLGQAFDRALGERRGIRRAAHFLFPMDDSLAQAAVDLSGRSYLVYKVEFMGTRSGELELDLLRDFFRSFSEHARLNLHLALFYGDNDHHSAEALFKALARALRAAVELDPRAADQVPSTKGSL
ncbi:MAG: imidazoleglycerol-phosphate dehydratase HisB [Candidatus Alcyoniella australis]|nr:imidazoleglycerol-phosphate dehydratase HisB [Candidatus Alcyoniella australis]